MGDHIVIITGYPPIPPKDFLGSLEQELTGGFGAVRCKLNGKAVYAYFADQANAVRAFRYFMDREFRGYPFVLGANYMNTGRVNSIAESLQKDARARIVATLNSIKADSPKGFDELLFSFPELSIFTRAQK